MVLFEFAVNFARFNSDLRLAVRQQTCMSAMHLTNELSYVILAFFINAVNISTIIAFN